MTLKIAVVVHGRFHAFDLTRALIQRGHDVTLLTNYPKWAVERFGIPKDRVRSFWNHGVLSRAAWKLQDRGVAHYPESWLHPMFGRWAVRELVREPWDVVHAWSGVSEEVHNATLGKSIVHFLLRGSAHIRAQARLLEEEERRTGAPQDRPSDWIIAREEREYELASAVIVLSSFARDTFLAQGVPAERVRVLLSGADLGAFRPDQSIVDARRQRILSGEPLRVLNVGTFSFRKGVWDLAPVVTTLAREGLEFRFVGPTSGEAASLARELRGNATFVPKQPQRRLPDSYAWGDIFTLPTIEDGFQSVLGQAAASALPILTTPNGAGRDIVREGENGWVVPIRSPQALIERLRWCNANRGEVADMVGRTFARFQPRDWDEVAADFELLCLGSLKGAEAGIRTGASADGI
jgi:glycosyltransferase involved in cell wall biosynthesis